MSDVYSAGKVLHFPHKLRDLREGRLTAPIHVRLKPTNTCTHRCSYCCYRNPELHLSERMDERDEIPHDKMLEIVADLADMGVRAVTFSGGGEPLCYPFIIEAVEGLLDGGMEVAELLARRATWVRISMDAADRELYAKTRSVRPEEFDRVCENIRGFARLDGRTCVLGLNLIVTRENRGDVRRFLEMSKELGADHVKVSGAVVSIKPKENAEYLAPFYDSAKAQIAEAAASLADASFGVVDKLHLPDSAEESFEREYTWCPFAQCLTVIAADLNVYTCQDKAYTTSGWLGSIRDRRFSELWSSGELKRRLRTLDPSRHCRHHCVAHGKNRMLLDYLETDPDHLDFV